MKKSFKVIFICIGVIIGIILLDSIQALIFDNNPLIGIETRSMKKSGILVDSHHCGNGKNVAVLKGSRYSCYKGDMVNISLQDVNDKINNYFANNIMDINISYWAIDDEKKVVVVGMMDISSENQNNFIHNVFSNCCGSKYIEYITENKMIEFKESIDIFDGKIININNNTITVEVLKDSKVLKKNDKVIVKINKSTDVTNNFYFIDNNVRITFNGMTEDSKPAQIGAVKIELITE